MRIPGGEVYRKVCTSQGLKSTRGKTQQLGKKPPNILHLQWPMFRSLFCINIRPKISLSKLLSISILKNQIVSSSHGIFSRTSCCHDFDKFQIWVQPVMAYLITHLDDLCCSYLDFCDYHIFIICHIFHHLSNRGI